MSSNLNSPSNLRPKSNFVLGRRQVLLASLSLPLAYSIAAHGEDGAFPQFLALSRKLTGYDDLDTQLAEHIYRSLGHIVGNLDHEVAALTAADDATLSQSALSKAILTAWYLGTVGSGPQTTCIAYVSTLQVRVVSDVLRPPTYAYGPYGSWHSQPRAA